MKQAQMTMIGLILLVVSIIALSAMTPVINTFTGTAAGNLTAGGHADAAVVVNLIPLFLWLGLVITVFIYTQVQR